MPNKDGIWLLEQIRKNHKFDKLKIITFTNLSQGKQLDKVTHQGVTKILLKSDTSLAQLLKCINQTLAIGN
jgi:DNA-binding NarL/FixJ family response regulator